MKDILRDMGVKGFAWVGLPESPFLRARTCARACVRVFVSVRVCLCKCVCWCETAEIDQGYLRGLCTTVR